MKTQLCAGSCLVVSVRSVITFLESGQCQVWELYSRGHICEKLFCFKTFSIVFRNRNGWRRLLGPVLIDMKY